VKIQMPCAIRTGAAKLSNIANVLKARIVQLGIALDQQWLQLDSAWLEP